jgi:hypothetical protein
VSTARATFVDDSGDVRLSGYLTLEDGTFAVDGALTVAPQDNLLDDLVLIEEPTGYADNSNTGNAIRLTDGTTDVLLMDAYGTLHITGPTGQGPPEVALLDSDHALSAVRLGPGIFSVSDSAGSNWIAGSPGQLILRSTEMGLFGHTSAPQPVLTSGTATPEQIALALQSYGVVGGT